MHTHHILVDLTRNMCFGRGQQFLRVKQGPVRWLGLPKFSSVRFLALFAEPWTEPSLIFQNWTENRTEQERTGSQQFCSVRFSVRTGELRLKDLKNCATYPFPHISIQIHILKTSLAQDARGKHATILVKNKKNKKVPSPMQNAGEGGQQY